MARYILQALYVLMSLSAVAVSISSLLGFGFLAFVAMFLLVIVGWVELNLASSQATKYLSAFALMGLCVFSLIAAGVLQSRENARRNQVMSNLRLWGQETQERRHHDPAQTVKQPTSPRLVADEIDEPE